LQTFKKFLFYVMPKSKSGLVLLVESAITLPWGKLRDDDNSRLLTGLASFSAEEWLQKHASVSEEDFAKDPSRNRFAILLSRTSHIAFHLGQTALISK
jgi:hypothetical protein